MEPSIVQVASNIILKTLELCFIKEHNQLVRMPWHWCYSGLCEYPIALLRIAVPKAWPSLTRFLSFSVQLPARNGRRARKWRSVWLAAEKLSWLCGMPVQHRWL